MGGVGTILPLTNCKRKKEGKNMNDETKKTTLKYVGADEVKFYDYDHKTERTATRYTFFTYDENGEYLGMTHQYSLAGDAVIDQKTFADLVNRITFARSVDDLEEIWHELKAMPRGYMNVALINWIYDKIFTELSASKSSQSPSD